jgi:hypothetical protein
METSMRREAPPDEERVRRLLSAILAQGERGPDGTDSWTLLSERLGNLDTLSDLERTALPFLVTRWRAEGRDLDGLPLLNGLRRKMVVRNRLTVAGAQAELDRLRSAGVPAIPLNGAALIGRVLPDTGLWPLADVDLWVRPGDHAAALSALASPGSDRTQRATSGPHAPMLRHSLGREVDIHRVPSHLFARRGCSDVAAEALFARAWERQSDGLPALADVIHLSFVNTLFSHAPGEPRAAFALVELDAVLRHPDVTDATLRAVVADSVEDRTAVILVEHLDWLGPGVSGPLDRFLIDHLDPALTADDQALRRWLVRLRHTGGDIGTSSGARGTTDGNADPLFRKRLRQLAHIHSAVPDESRTVLRWLVLADLQDVRRSPSAALIALGRAGARRRIGHLLRSILRSIRPAAATLPPA